MKQLRHGIILSLTSLVTTLLLLNVGLVAFDPTGAVAYWNDQHTLHLGGVPDAARGYQLKPGTYHLHNSTVHILENGTRALPDTSDAACQIVVLGGSVTFGHGVNDNETWVNLLARQFQQAHFTNVALNGFNSGNIRGTVEVWPADGYIYLMHHTDDEAPNVWAPNWQEDPSTSALAVYLMDARHRLFDGEGQVWPTFEEDMRVIMARTPLAFTFEPSWAARFGAILLDDYTSTNSIADIHPDAEGHRQIANEMAPYVEEWLPSICE